jgi:hypothetical protein
MQARAIQSVLEASTHIIPFTLYYIDHVAANISLYYLNIIYQVTCVGTHVVLSHLISNTVSTLKLLCNLCKDSIKLAVSIPNHAAANLYVPNPVVFLTSYLSALYYGVLFIAYLVISIPLRVIAFCIRVILVILHSVVEDARFIIEQYPLLMILVVVLFILFDLSLTCAPSSQSPTISYAGSSYVSSYGFTTPRKPFTGIGDGYRVVSGSLTPTYTGPRGGTYYINSRGNKSYFKS